MEKADTDFEDGISALAYSSSAELIDIGYEHMPDKVRLLMTTLRENTINHAGDPLYCKGYSHRCLKPASEPLWDSGLVQFWDDDFNVAAFSRCIYTGLKTVCAVAVYNPNSQNRTPNTYDLFFELFTEGADNISFAKRFSMGAETTKCQRAATIGRVLSEFSDKMDAYVGSMPLSPESLVS